MDTTPDRTLTVHDVKFAWNQAQRAKQEYQRLMRSYRAILAHAVDSNAVRQCDVSEEISRDRESLRRDREQAKAERDTRASVGLD